MLSALNFLAVHSVPRLLSTRILAMINADNTTPPMHDLKNTPPDSSLGGETERDTEDPPEPSPDGPPDGPPDGGAAAWLVVLGAWCCSFSSPGWINSPWPPDCTYHPKSHIG